MKHHFNKHQNVWLSIQAEGGKDTELGQNMETVAWNDLESGLLAANWRTEAGKQNINRECWLLQAVIIS